MAKKAKKVITKKKPLKKKARVSKEVEKPVIELVWKLPFSRDTDTAHLHIWDDILAKYRIVRAVEKYDTNSYFTPMEFKQNNLPHTIPFWDHVIHLRNGVGRYKTLREALDVIDRVFCADKNIPLKEAKNREDVISHAAERGILDLPITNVPIQEVVNGEVTAPKPQRQKPKVSTKGVDIYGTRIDTDCARANALLSTKPQTEKEIRKKIGAKASLEYHFDKLVRLELLHWTEKGGYFLKK